MVTKIYKSIITAIFISASLLVCLSATAAALSPAATLSSANKILAITPCGGGGNQGRYTPSIDIGCSGKGNPIMDSMFGIIHFLSDGVGLIVIASMIWAGIQYSSTRGDPQASTNAMKRIQSNVIAL